MISIATLTDNLQWINFPITYLLPINPYLLTLIYLLPNTTR